MNKNYKRHQILILLYSLLSFPTFAQFGGTNLAVWVNEAIINTYTFDFKNLKEEQQSIAKYFTSDGWIKFTQAMQAAKLIESVQTNSYYVSAVATKPPVIKKISAHEWEATMPILVIYQGASYQQKQTLLIKLNLVESGVQGVRGYAITNFISTPSALPCKCASLKSSAAIV